MRRIGRSLCRVAADEALRARVRAHLSPMADVEEKQIVGGVGFTWRGHLLCGVLADDLLVRIGKADFTTFVAEPGARPMVDGRPDEQGLDPRRPVGRAPRTVDDQMARPRDQLRALATGEVAPRQW